MVPHCCSIMLAGTFQTIRYPAWAAGRVYYRFKRAEKGPRLDSLVRGISCTITPLTIYGVILYPLQSIYCS